MEASASESWLWYGQDVEVPPGSRGVPRRKQLWPCPDCVTDLGSEEECDAFFARCATGELEQ